MNEGNPRSQRRKRVERSMNERKTRPQRRKRVKRPMNNERGKENYVRSNTGKSD